MRRFERAACVGFVLACSLWAKAAHAQWPALPDLSLIPAPAGSASGRPQVCADGEHGWLLAWNQYASEGLGVRVQRFDRFGAGQWGPHGRFIPVADAYPGSQSGIAGLHALSDGHALVFVQTGSPTRLEVSCLDAAGLACWGPVIASASDTVNTFSVRVCPTAGDEAWLTWRAYRGPFGDYLQRSRGRRIGAGEPASWGPILDLGDARPMQGNAPAEADSSGALFLGWTQYEGADIKTRLLKVLPDGSLPWGVEGVLVAVVPGHVWMPRLAPDGHGGVFVAFENEVLTSVVFVGVQRLRADGARAWGPTGLRPPSAWYQSLDEPRIARTRDAEAVVVCHEAGINGLAYARVDTLGTWDPPDTGRPLTETLHYAWDRDIIGIGDGGFVALWSGQVDPDHIGVAGQRIDALGRRLWSDSGAVAIRFPRFTGPYPDASHVWSLGPRGDLLAAWTARTSEGQSSSSRVYYNHLDENGRTGVTLPRITTLSDIPGDEGGRLEVRWDATPLDQEGGLVFDHLVEMDADGAGAWAPVDSVPAAGASSYSLVVTGANDSLGGSPARSRIRILARLTEGAPLASPPDSAWAIDDLPPATPASFRAEQGPGLHRLSWARGVEPDLSHYRVDRSVAPADPSGPYEPIASLADTVLEVPGLGLQHYRATAVDSHGNESPAAEASTEGSVSAEAGGRGPLRLWPVAPSPASGDVVARWELPAAGPVRLTLHDTSGRRVTEAFVGAGRAGHHEARVALRDGRGTPLSPGLYFLRLTWGERSESRRVVVAR